MATQVPTLSRVRDSGNSGASSLYETGRSISAYEDHHTQTIGVTIITSPYRGACGPDLTVVFHAVLWTPESDQARWNAQADKYPSDFFAIVRAYLGREIDDDEVARRLLALGMPIVSVWGSHPNEIVNQAIIDASAR